LAGPYLESRRARSEKFVPVLQKPRGGLPGERVSRLIGLNNRT
jgi:hypothetical protein